MAVKKKNAEEAIEVEAVEVSIDTPVEEDKVVETTDVKDKEEEIVVTPTSVEEPKEVTCKIRMRVDHKCTIAMVRYDLKEGQVYTVPKNVKDILNRVGLLAPLN